MYMCMGVTCPGRLSAAPLVTYLDGLIGGDALASAVKFLPVAKYRCTNHIQNSRQYHRSRTRRRPGTTSDSSLGLPRVRPSMHACMRVTEVAITLIHGHLCGLVWCVVWQVGVWRASQKGLVFEGKLAVRTDRVRRCLTLSCFLAHLAWAH